MICYFFKQKTAYEMRISDWSSDACSSGLLAEVDEEVGLDGRALEEGLVDLRVVEARHRSGVEAERARGQDQVGALQAAVAERRLAASIAGAVEPALGVGMR